MSFFVYTKFLKKLIFLSLWIHGDDFFYADESAGGERQKSKQHQHYVFNKHPIISAEIIGIPKNRFKHSWHHETCWKKILDFEH